ncbi:isoprenylcysteine carboxylmethyltransferase family protein [Arthrobacter sp. MI7-26]|uniref:methyltransferase family protein n=1 Tax=Arthrobacter sp. MI7-26 TaxID=2993653 RepID=UPI002248A23B|nr:isoprenylcysteine carboxylmethyltransferase family protein [Arthrobacter sp. MI7-26]MCX2748599.1 isoprenylcysteine carboxylmethyltransferase family protein [Arthrobacter sp. MI7-26]
MRASGDATREKRLAALGTTVFAIAPATVAGLLPWVVTRWKVQEPVPGGLVAQCAGVLLIGAGTAVITDSFVRFALEGLGTPAPFAPPKNLVVSGCYRFVRNPIYVAIGSAVTGQGLLLGQPRLFVLAALGAVPVVAFVRLHEEPTLARKFGAEYEDYRASVPRWLPRFTPWRQG